MASVDCEWFCGNVASKPSRLMALIREKPLCYAVSRFLTVS